MFPATTPAEEVLATKPAGIFFSNGPGDPAALDYVGRNAKVAAESGVPVFGICLGHQVLAMGMGGTTFKLKFGHRGTNHPVKHLETGKVEITSQNHGFAVDPASLPNDVEVTHLNLYDNTVEGLKHRELPVFCVQYHPEAAPGPHDADYLFGKFLDSIDGKKHRVPKRTDIRRVLVIGSGPDRHRPGVRVRLLGHAGLQGAARRRPRGRAGQQQPGDDHDRPGAGRPHLRRAAHRRRRRARSSSASGRTRCCRPSAARPRSTSPSSSRSTASSTSTA